MCPIANGGATSQVLLAAGNCRLVSQQRQKKKSVGEISGIRRGARLVIIVLRRTLRRA